MKLKYVGGLFVAGVMGLSGNLEANLEDTPENDCHDHAHRSWARSRARIESNTLHHDALSGEMRRRIQVQGFFADAVTAYALVRKYESVFLIAVWCSLINAFASPCLDATG